MQCDPGPLFHHIYWENPFKSHKTFNPRSYKYNYDPALAEDEPTFNYDDEIDDYQALQNETHNSSILEDTFAKIWNNKRTSNYPDSGADTYKRQASPNSPQKKQLINSKHSLYFPVC